MILTHLQQLDNFLEARRAKGGPMSIDTETDGIPPAHGKRICGIGLGYRVDPQTIDTCYIPIRHEVWNQRKSIFGDTEKVLNLDPKSVLDRLKPDLEDPKVIKPSHNSVHELQIFRNEGIEVKGAHCTLIMSYLADPLLPNALKTRLKIHFGDDLLHQERVKTWLKLNGFNKELIHQHGYKYVPLEVISPYTEILDCAGCLRLFEFLGPKLAKLRGVYSIEWGVMPVLAEMGMAGFPVCVKETEKLLEEVNGYVKEAEQWMFACAGREFTPSPEQVSCILFEELGVEIPKQRGKGLTDSKTLSNVNHPLAKAILAYRSAEKIKGTYLEPLLRSQIYKGHVHSTFHQVKSRGDDEDMEEGDNEGGADTGRLASEDPNISNIAKPKELQLQSGKVTIVLKKIFRIPDNELDEVQFVTNDWDQLEMRLLAEESGDEALIAGLKAGQDFHTTTAITIFKKKPEDHDPNFWKTEYRSKAKTLNFAICLAPGTQVITETGPKSIELIDIGELVLTHQKRFRPVTALQKHRNAPSLVIKTNTGKRVQCTPDHGWLVQIPTKNGKRQPRVWRKASELKTGDYLCYHNNGWEQDKNQRTIGEAISRTMGWYVSEGHYSNWSMKISQSEIANPDVWACMSQALPALGFTTMVHSPGVTSFYLPAGRRQVLFDLGIDKTWRSATVRIPPVVFSLPKKERLAFLAGLWDGDGWLSNTHGNPGQCNIGIGSDSTELLVDTQRLLDSVGINSNIYRKSEGKSNTQLYIVTSEGKQRFVDLVPTVKVDRIRYNPKKRFYTEEEIVQIEDGGILEEVFDLTVEEDSSFIANGLVSHNCYGIGPKTLSVNLGITEDEARALLEQYFGALPGVKAFSQDCIQFAEKHGFIETRFGRPRPLSKRDCYKAPNSRIQGTAADMNKLALTRIRNQFKARGYKSHIVNDVHDDIITKHLKNELDVPRIMKTEMENWPMFRVPIVAEPEFCWPSWADKRAPTPEEKVLYGLSS